MCPRYPSLDCLRSHTPKSLASNLNNRIATKHSLVYIFKMSLSHLKVYIGIFSTTKKSFSVAWSTLNYSRGGCGGGGGGLFRQDIP